MEKYDALKLEKQLCFPLYAVSKEIVKKYKPFLDELDLTYTQYITMMVMWEHKEMNVKELGEHLYLDSGTLTPVLKKLEQKGWVKRNRAKEDERVLIVTLTTEGEKLKPWKFRKRLVGASVLIRKRQHHFIKFYIKYWGICNYLQIFRLIA